MGRRINNEVREKEILDMMSRNGYTRAEAEELWEWDNSEEETEETKEMEKNWRSISRTAHDARTVKSAGEKKEKQKRNYKPNNAKREFIQAFKETLESFEGVTTVEVTNIEKYITFIGPDGLHYTVNLICNRKLNKKEGNIK